MKQFEDLTIKELKELHTQYLKQNPNIQTAEELLDELNKQQEGKNKWNSKL